MQNMLRNALWTWGTYWEPIRNLEGTPWEHIGKQGKMEKKSFYCPSGFRGGFILPFLYKARTGPAGTLPCPARPCWPPSQPVSPSPVPDRARHRHSQSAPLPFFPAPFFPWYLLGIIGKKRKLNKRQGFTDCEGFENGMPDHIFLSSFHDSCTR